MIDLHTHSTYSDGSDQPEVLVALAAQAGLTAMALTDHDGLAGIAEARAAASTEGVEVVAGCEVSCRFSPGTLHMLCYFLDPEDEGGALQRQLEVLQDDRADRNGKLAERLSELGFPLTLADVRAEAGGTTIGRPHFAAALMKLGAVSSHQEAFDKWLGKGRPAYVPKATVFAADVIDLVRRSGGVAVLAHPRSLALSLPELDGTLADLAELGLGGLECWYARYTVEERRELADMARRHGLVATGGSDYHGTFKPDLALGTGSGDLEVPDDVLAELKARRP